MTIKRARLGQRGAYLVIHGLAWICYGVGILIDPAFGVKRGLGWVAHLLPFDRLAWLWIICGAASIVYAPMRKPGKDGWGFMFILLPPALWGLWYLLGIPSYGRGGFAAVVWVATALSVAIVAGMPERDEGLK
jgi:hypothetical protein